ncbi:MAG: hypothetical protein JST36_07855 [Bacteroidetes bacterium]|nr:hypothetical protein [Bacteroidota bacterium]
MDYRQMRNEHKDYQDFRREIGRRKERGRIMFGIIAAVVGVLLLLHNLFPGLGIFIHFSWPIVLIIVGIFVGIRSNFRSNAWWILILIGGFFLAQPYLFSDIDARKIVWPSVLILLGLAMIFRRGHEDRRCDFRGFNSVTNDADALNIDVVFGGRKEIVTSKNFKGGSLRATFGGVELNLCSADAGPEPMVLDVRINFGGAEIIVPGNWDVQNEINPMMGSVEDQRSNYRGDATETRKLLILKGTVNFGSVEIKGY